MSSAIALAAALALVCAAVALLLWQRGQREVGRASAERFVDSRIASAARLPAAPGNAQRQAPHSPRPAAAAVNAGAALAWHERRTRLAFALQSLLSRAGIGDARALALAVLGATGVLCLWVALNAGALAACGAGIGCLALACLAVTARSQRRRLRIVQQLPSFLDGIVRLVTLGNSVPAAFQAALQTTETPLRECLDDVSRMLRAGVEIDRALYQVAAIYRTRQFELVGAVLRLSVKYGGRADVMLDRMSTFMRDLEQAERELVAMSAETRLSAVVLVLMPIVIGGVLLTTNPDYFAAMWRDELGRRLVYLAFAMQVGGGYLLYRFTQLRS